MMKLEDSKKHNNIIREYEIQANQTDRQSVDEERDSECLCRFDREIFVKNSFFIILFFLNDKRLKLIVLCCVLLIRIFQG